jgi:hypothetical protein
MFLESIRYKWYSGIIVMVTLVSLLLIILIFI